MINITLKQPVLFQIIDILHRANKKRQELPAYFKLCKLSVF